MCRWIVTSLRSQIRFTLPYNKHYTGLTTITLKVELEGSFYMLDAILVFCFTLSILHVLSILIPLLRKIHFNATLPLEGLCMLPNTIQELENSFNNWENIVLWEFDDFDRMTYIYNLVIKTSDGKHYKAYVNSDDGEQPQEDFKDLEWFEVELKEITIKAWIPK